MNTNIQYNKVRKNGMVAVLYSPGYGAGWYSWNEKYEGLLFDEDIVNHVLSGNLNLARRVAEEKYPDAYLGGIDDLKVEWIQEGLVFEINEYDGHESIHIIGERDYLTA